MPLISRQRRVPVQILGSALALLVGCSDDPVDVEYAHARQAGQAAGYAEGQALGFEAGVSEGRAQGFERGRKEGRVRAVLRWAPIGVGAGVLIGLLIVASMRSEQVAEARKERRLRVALHKAFGRLPADLDATGRARLEAILTVRQALDEALRTAAGPTAEALRAWLSGRLKAVDETALELSALMSRLRTALRDVPAQSLEVLDQRRADLKAESDPTLMAAIEASVAAQTRALAAQTRAESGLQRCALQLEAVEAFLSHARMSVATAQSDVDDQLTALGAEVDGISTAARIARDELAAI